MSGAEDFKIVLFVNSCFTQRSLEFQNLDIYY
jgi:hypothetical protein